ncbi:DUF1801 domain-containing protein [Roseinatronobacter monicus]|uniref:DUF1801 domain-containing protein n=1 Tax=Roseinatronobacter monicus TaxID=393481 RepID=UPI001BAA22C9|nr:DUF1801 domain-containing protein [Roseinatronobacter monicus]
MARLRDIALASGPQITEEVKYGGILFASRTGFCGVFAYRNHVTLEFSVGRQLPDPHGVLAGKGKFRRHIRIDTEHDIEAKCVDEYLNAARAHSDAQ